MKWELAKKKEATSKQMQQEHLIEREERERPEKDAKKQVETAARLKEAIPKRKVMAETRESKCLKMCFNRASQRIMPYKQI